MQTKFLIFIAIVFIITIIFGILIWRQTLIFERKALAAKQRKEEYIKQLEQELQEKEQAGQLEPSEQPESKSEEEEIDSDR